MKKYGLLLLSLFLLFLGGCGRKYDYTIHKPKVQYEKPSRKALSGILDKQLGKPYVWAEEGPDRFDCSGYTYYMYGSMGIEIPRTAHEQAKRGKYIKPSELQYGDLIFFDTTIIMGFH